MGGVVGFVAFFLISVNDSEEVSRCRRGVFISARSGEEAGASPESNIFSSHAKKSAAKEPCVLPVPKALPALPDSFSTAIAPVAPHSHARVFLLLSAILKTRNKRIFNEPPRGRACALFGVQGWSGPSRAPGARGLSLPPDPEAEREKGVRAEPGPVWGRHRLEAHSAPTEGKDFPGMGNAAPGKVSWVLVRIGSQRRAPHTLQGHLGLGSSVTAEGHSSHGHQPLLRRDFKR